MAYCGLLAYFEKKRSGYAYDYIIVTILAYYILILLKISMIFKKN